VTSRVGGVRASTERAKGSDHTHRAAAFSWRMAAASTPVATVAGDVALCRSVQICGARIWHDWAWALGNQPQPDRQVGLAEPSGRPVGGVVRGGIEPPTPRSSGARFGTNWPDCAELSESTVAEAVVGWTDLDGGAVGPGAARATLGWHPVGPVASYGQRPLSASQ